MAGLTCEEYPGIIEIWDIQFPKKIAGFCDNSIHMKNECLASENDERNLTSQLGKYCDGKRSCNIHLAHGLYRGIHLPCRDLNASVQIEIFFYCIYCKFKCFLLYTTRPLEVALSIMKNGRGTKWISKLKSVLKCVRLSSLRPLISRSQIL